MSSNSWIFPSTVSNLLLILLRVFFFILDIILLITRSCVWVFFCMFHSSSHHVHVFFCLLKQMQYTYNNCFKDYWSTLSSLPFVVQFLLLFLLFKDPIPCFCTHGNFFISCWRLWILSLGSGICCIPLTIIGLCSWIQLIWGCLVSFIMACPSSLQPGANKFPLLRQHPSEDSTWCPVYFPLSPVRK